LISLSPLHTAPPKLLQQLPVRASGDREVPFTLAMCRSPRFGSPAGGSAELFTPFAFTAPSPSGLDHPPCRNLPPHYTIGTAVGPGRPQPECQPLDFEPTRSRFRRLFPFPHGTCSLSITGREVRLERGRPLFPRTVLGPGYSPLPPAAVGVRDWCLPCIVCFRFPSARGLPPLGGGATRVRSPLLAVIG
jgi:hypothetical protein